MCDKQMDGWSSCKLEQQTMPTKTRIETTSALQYQKYKHNLYNSPLRCKVLIMLSNVNEETGEEEPSIQQTTKTLRKSLKKKKKIEIRKCIKLVLERVQADRHKQQTWNFGSMHHCLGACESQQRFNRLKKALFFSKYCFYEC